MLSLGLAARGARGGRGVGQWKTVDEKSGAVQSVVEIYDQGGKLFGKIVSLTKPTDEQGIVGDLLRSGSSSRQSQPDPPREVGRLVPAWAGALMWPRRFSSANGRLRSRRPCS